MNRIHVGEGIGAAAWPGLPGRDRCAEAGGPGTSSKGHLPLRDWVEEGSEGHCVGQGRTELGWPRGRGRINSTCHTEVSCHLTISNKNWCFGKPRWWGVFRMNPGSREPTALNLAGVCRSLRSAPSKLSYLLLFIFRHVSSELLSAGVLFTALPSPEGTLLVPSAPLMSLLLP